MGRPSDRRGSYTSLIGFNPRWHTGMSSLAMDLDRCLYAKSYYYYYNEFPARWMSIVQQADIHVYMYLNGGQGWTDTGCTATGLSIAGAGEAISR